MATTSFTQTPLNADLQRVIINLNMIAEDLDHVFGGKIDTKNIREIAGWVATRYKLQSKDGDVGFNTQDTTDDDIRIWAGDAFDGTPKFVVTKSGKLYAIDGHFSGNITGSVIIGGEIYGAYIATAKDTFPRIEFSSEDKLLKASSDANNYLSFSPEYNLSPTMRFHDPSSDTDFYVGFGGDFIINSQNSNMQVGAQNGNLNLLNGSGKFTRANFSQFQNKVNSRTLQQELDSLQSSISSLSSLYSSLASRISALESRP